MKLDLSPWKTGIQSRSTLAPSAETRDDWRQRQRARLRSIRQLARGGGRGLGWSLIFTATLWLLLFGALCLAFKT